jgi:hypothetical protein
MMHIIDSLRIAGRRFFGRSYLKELAKRLGTDVYTLRRWFRTGGPKDLHKRRDEMFRELMRERLRDAVSAATMLAKLQNQASIWDRDRANRLVDLMGELYPAAPLYDDRVSTQPDMSTQPKTVDELCEDSHPMVAACFREAMEGIE